MTISSTAARRGLTALLAVAVVPLTVTPAAFAGSSSPAARATGAQVRVQRTTSPFSPNDDGHRDRVVVSYRLKGAARVSVEVKRGKKTVVSTRETSMGSGAHRFTWDGTAATGRRVADGRYRVLVHARAGGRIRTDAARVVVDTKPTVIDAGTLALSSNMLYPRTRVIEDVVVGNFDLTDLSRVGDWGVRNLPGRAIETTRAQVLDRAGHVVTTEPVSSVASREGGIDDPIHCGRCGRFTWDGHDSAGVLQPPGVYRIRIIQGRDAAGNPRVISGAQDVTVSDGRLVAKTTTRTYVAADAPRTGQPWTGCNDCPPGCSLTPSTTIPGGLALCAGSHYFTAPVTGRRTPYDRVAVAVTGASTRPGGWGTLQAGPLEWDAAVVQLYSGSQEAYGKFMPNTEVYPDDWPPPVLWRVEGNGYDVASFTVAITTYVPSS